MDKPVTQRFMDVEGMAQYLCLSQDTVRAWVKTRQIPFSKLGRAVRFDMHKIEEWLKAKEVKIYLGRTVGLCSNPHVTSSENVKYASVSKG